MQHWQLESGAEQGIPICQKKMKKNVSSMKKEYIFIAIIGSSFSLINSVKKEAEYHFIDAHN